MEEIKVKIDDLKYVSELGEYGQVTYESEFLNLVFMNVDDGMKYEIRKLPFVQVVSIQRKGSFNSQYKKKGKN